MPRTRLRPDYTQWNYTYTCSILGEIPASVWHTARGMQTLWNLLVTQHDALLAPWDDLTTRAVKKAAYLQFWREAYTTIRDEGARLGLACWPKWHVFDTFQAAQRRWAQHLGGKPHAHYGLRRILLPHRTQSGGVPLAWLWQDTARKHTAILPPEPGHQHRRAYVTVGESRIPLLVLLHRPVPAEAILKRLALVGTFEPALRRVVPRSGTNPDAFTPDTAWSWQLQLTIEMPAPTPLPATRRVCAMDLGWRVREEGLRLAVVSTGTQHWEWLLPWNMANARLRRLQARFEAHRNPCEATGSWRQVWALQSVCDTHLDACKGTLQASDRSGWPPEAVLLWGQWHKVKAGSLRRLRRLLGEAGIILPDLESWYERHTELARRIRAAQLRLQRARTHLYRHLADWLARHFDVVVWEADLSLKELAETTTPGEYALQQSRRYRQTAGLSQLRLYVREALSEAGRVLMPGQAAGTTNTCAACGAAIPTGSGLALECLNGHRRDTDVNSALNLLAQAAEAGYQHDARQPVPTVDREQLRRGLVRLIERDSDGEMPGSARSPQEQQQRRASHGGQLQPVTDSPQPLRGLGGALTLPPPTP